METGYHIDNFIRNFEGRGLAQALKCDWNEMINTNKESLENISENILYIILLPIILPLRVLVAGVLPDDYFCRQNGDAWRSYKE